jgi:hypothetical protein
VVWGDADEFAVHVVEVAHVQCKVAMVVEVDWVEWGCAGEERARD